MSWSVTAVGKPRAVAAKLAEQFERNPCAEPEETIRQSVAGIIATSLAAMPEASAVQVEAHGSQSYDGATESHTNTLGVNIKPLYGYVE